MQNNSNVTYEHCNIGCLDITVAIGIEQFLLKSKQGPDYVYTCCHRMMYRSCVQLFKSAHEYTKLNSANQSAAFSKDTLKLSANVLTWICITCHRQLLQGKIPPQSKANKLQLDTIPTVWMYWNFVCWYFKFHSWKSVIVLPSGKQRYIQGPAINVLARVDNVVNVLSI